MCTSAIVVDLISDGGQSCVRGTQAPTLSSEFCIVQVLEVPMNCLLHGIARCLYLGVILSIVLMALQLGQCQVAV